MSFEPTVADDRTVIGEPSFWMVNLWLAFLVFPLVSIVLDNDLSSERKWATVGILALFAGVHISGYRTLTQQAMDPQPRNQTTKPRLLDVRGPQLWFSLIVGLTILGLIVGGWGMLGVTPFVVSFAVFNFSWRTIAAVTLPTLLFVIAGPAAVGKLNDLWFFGPLVAGVAGATILARVTDARAADVTALRTRLLISEERERVARDVHDVLGHSLTAIILKTQVTDRFLAAAPERGEEIDAARLQLGEMEAVSRRALAEIRATVSGLRSADLADELVAARAVLADAEVKLTIVGAPVDVPAVHHHVLGWVVRESVTNIVRHSSAEQCTIRLGQSGALIEVSDDGVGFNGSSEGNGISGLRERLDAAGLHLELGEGATLSVLSKVDA